MAEYYLELKGVSKSFPGVKALDNVSLSVRPGTVHALMGENGAGKSTLMKCLFGIYKMDAGEVYINGEKVILLKPLSYMNLSGEVVQSFANYYDIDSSNILVISDDLDLDFLDYRLRLFGSSGGHNGLKDIERCLGSNRFRRFRIGISNNKNIDTKDYVLSRFSKEELDNIDEFLPKTETILSDFCSMSFERLMSKYNKKNS